MRHKWYAKKIVSLSNTAKKLQWDDLFKRSNVVTRHKDNSQRVFRQERSWVRNLLARNIFSCCFIDNGCLCSPSALILGPSAPISSALGPEMEIKMIFGSYIEKGLVDCESIEEFEQKLLQFYESVLLDNDTRSFVQY